MGLRTPDEAADAQAQAKPIQEDMPFRLVEKALVAAGQRKTAEGESTCGAFNDCIYQLGLEGRVPFTPRNQEEVPP